MGHELHTGVPPGVELMPAQIIDGKAISREILDGIKSEVDSLKAQGKGVPGLVTILVGANPASLSYVTLKIRTALDLGFREVQENLDADVSEADLLAMVAAVQPGSGHPRDTRAASAAGSHR